MTLKPCVYIPNEVVRATLGNTPAPGKRQLEPFKALAAGTAGNILEDHRILDNQVEVHRHEADLWICLEGEADFTVGGELVGAWAKEGDDRELKAPTDGIVGGTRHTLRRGDVLWIPAGQPHVHTAKGTARLYIVKVPQAEVPLSEVPGWK